MKLKEITIAKTDREKLKKHYQLEGEEEVVEFIPQEVITGGFPKEIFIHGAFRVLVKK